MRWKLTEAQDIKDKTTTRGPYPTGRTTLVVAPGFSWADAGLGSASPA